MSKLRQWGTSALVAVLMSACASPEPTEQTLRDSFFEQVAAAGFGREMTRTGDELTFVGPKGSKPDANWRVRIDSAVLEPQASERNPFKGAIESSWLVDGQALLSSGSFSGLPDEFLKKGIGQECYALWDATKKAWTWE